MENFKLGDRVKVLGKNTKGEVAFVGDTHFSDGVWLGISLDEPKGRNNGTVEGVRYFKCARNHGVFVRACQIEKESPDSANGSDKINISSSRIAYPNYLKSSSKLKCEKHLCVLKNELRKTKSQLKSVNNASSETVRTSNAIEKSTELQTVKQENEDLKKKLEETEKSLKETLEKYDKAMDEITQMSADLDAKKKQIKAQKFSLKLLKLRQCNHYKNIDSSGKKTCQVSNDRSLDDLKSLVEGDPNLSDDELDPQNIITFSSLKRTVELEEQNRIMIEGLVELREFLKSQSKPQHTENLNKNNKSKLRNRRSKSNLNYSTPSMKGNGFPTRETQSDIKEYGNVLRDMIRFTEIMKEKGGLDKECASFTSVFLNPSGDVISNQKEPISINNFNKFIHFTNQLGSDCRIPDYVDTPTVQTDPEHPQHSLVLKECDFQGYLKVGDNLRTKKSFKVPSKMKISSCYNDIGDTGVSKIPSYENELNKHIAPIAPKSRETSYCDFNESFTQENTAVFNKNPVSTYYSDSLEYQRELRIALPSHSNMSFQ